MASSLDRVFKWLKAQLHSPSDLNYFLDLNPQIDGCSNFTLSL